MLPGHKAHYIGDEGDPQHITKRSKARDDRLSNLLWVCRASHNAMDQARPALRKQWEHAAKERMGQPYVAGLAGTTCTSGAVVESTDSQSRFVAPTKRGPTF
jgi:hypothetical protein